MRSEKGRAREESPLAAPPGDDKTADADAVVGANMQHEYVSGRAASSTLWCPRSGVLLDAPGLRCVALPAGDLERVTRLELATSSLARRCSTTELHPQPKLADSNNVRRPKARKALFFHWCSCS